MKILVAGQIILSTFQLYQNRANRVIDGGRIFSFILNFQMQPIIFDESSLVIIGATPIIFYCYKCNLPNFTVF
jgi:hypothetical protein